jgi:hypothetical protein
MSAGLMLAEQDFQNWASLVGFLVLGHPYLY